MQIGKLESLSCGNSTHCEGDIHENEMDAAHFVAPLSLDRDSDTFNAWFVGIVDDVVRLLLFCLLSFEYDRKVYRL